MSRDVYEDVFESPSLLDKKPPIKGEFDDASWTEYLLDISISLFIVQTLVIASWWGFSGLQDSLLGETGSDIWVKFQYIFNKNSSSHPLPSFYKYIIAGYGLAFLAYYLQPSANFPCDGHHQHWKLKIWSDMVKKYLFSHKSYSAGFE